MVKRYSLHITLMQQDNLVFYVFIHILLFRYKKFQNRENIHSMSSNRYHLITFYTVNQR